MSFVFSDSDCDALYRIIGARRDVRHFSPAPIPENVLRRIVQAAHFAPSVGFMQPWEFILITSLEIRREVKRLFDETNQAELTTLSDPERKDLYRSLKLEGILEAPMNIAVTCDHGRGSPFVLGRRPMPETALFSTCLAIENMWLAARAEGVGIGWVSILDRTAVERLLHLPAHVQLVAYLCVGYPKEFTPRPMLEEVGWRDRIDLATLVYEDRWGQPSELFAEGEPTRNAQRTGEV